MSVAAAGPDATATARAHFVLREACDGGACVYRVRAVNGAETACADGESQSECDVASIDLGPSGLAGDAAEGLVAYAVSGGAERAASVVFGGELRTSSESIGEPEPVLVVREVYRAPSVRRHGLRYFQVGGGPEGLVLSELNTGRTRPAVVSSFEVPEGEASAPKPLPPGMVVTGVLDAELFDGNQYFEALHR
jgi:hypothetical protein